MLLSNDSKSLFIGNPKTGTSTARSVLQPYGFYISDSHSSSPSQHATYDECITLLSALKPSFNLSQLEHIYVFWRDPFKRFISAYNHVKRSLNGGNGYAVLSRNRPNIFTSDNLDIDPVNLLLDRINTPVKKYEDPIGQILLPQSRWIKPSAITTILNFDNFENNLKIVAAAFGADVANLAIPTLNESPDTGLEITPVLESLIREYYAEDFTLI